MIVKYTIEQGLAALNQGEVIAYPTEAVYGLGCDPFKQEAVESLLRLKQRAQEKGLILLVKSYQQLDSLIEENLDLSKIMQSWPGPITWLIPKNKTIPQWVSGKHQSIAIRMSAHPIASALCANGPIISTSANISTLPPALSLADLEQQFPHGIAGCVEGELGGAKNPSQIWDYLTNHRLR